MVIPQNTMVIPQKDILYLWDNQFGLLRITAVSPKDILYLWNNQLGLPRVTTVSIKRYSAFVT